VERSFGFVGPPTHLENAVLAALNQRVGRLLKSTYALSPSNHRSDCTFPSSILRHRASTAFTQWQAVCTSDSEALPKSQLAPKDECAEGYESL
jgi:hypothetical protein